MCRDEGDVLIITLVIVSTHSHLCGLRLNGCAISAEFTFMLLHSADLHNSICIMVYQRNYFSKTR